MNQVSGNYKSCNVNDPVYDSDGNMVGTSDTEHNGDLCFYVSNQISNSYKSCTVKYPVYDSSDRTESKAFSVERIPIYHPFQELQKLCSLYKVSDTNMI